MAGAQQRVSPTIPHLSPIAYRVTYKTHWKHSMYLKTAHLCNPAPGLSPDLALALSPNQCALALTLTLSLT